MKYLILLILVFVFSNAHAQYHQHHVTATANKDSSLEIKDQAYYLAKSKKQTTAWLVLLGGGVALVGTGLLIGAGDNASFNDAETGVILGVIGLSSMIASIPFFVTSRVNKAKSKFELTAQYTINIPGRSTVLVKGLTWSLPLGR